MSLGNNIYHLRKEKGYSQEDLANLCHVSRQTISKWEADEVMPDTNNLLELSKVFHITIDEMLKNPVMSSQPDMFDKGVNLVKKHWAKIGYRFVLSGAILIGFSFLMKAVTSSFFNMQNNVMNDFGFGSFFGSTASPFDTMQNGMSNMFGMFSNFALILGIISLVGGLALVIYDYKKNYYKQS